MPRQKLKKPPSQFRKQIVLPNRQREIVDGIDNFSAFVQLAVDNAAGIMAWDAIKRQKGVEDQEKIEDELPGFNAAHPQNDLTKQRIKPSENSPSKPELW